ncbi:carrier protein ymc1 [Sporothrix eucalyptigena]
MNADVLLEDAQRGVSEAAKDFTAGAVGGVAQVLIGQPFDLIKVRLQVQGGGSIGHLVREIWTQEGPLAFYKVSIQFGAFEACRQAVQAWTAKEHLGLPLLYLCGGGAGIVNSAVSGPMEQVRIRLQLQPAPRSKSMSSQRPLYAGPWDCLRTIVAHDGLRGLYRGQVATLMRDFQGFGLWFATYETLVELALRVHGTASRRELSGWTAALCGAAAGEAFWLGAHPLDVVKSKMQNDGLGALRRHHSVRQVVVQTWRAGGLRAFYYGLAPAMMRTALTSGGTFATVELARKLMD